MADVSMRQMLEAGVHFGHQTRYWNPKMAPYIFGERNKIHIINLEKSLPLAREACAFIKSTVADGGKVMFVGTKRAARESVRTHAARSSMPFVSYRWLGGMLTNFQTIHKRILYMLELEQMEESGEMEALLKKERLKLRHELEKLHTVLGGVRDLQRIPDAVFVIDVMEEQIAVAEANRPDIPLIAIVDTNTDPDPIDLVIPGNDDAIRTAFLISGAIADAAREGTELREAKNKELVAAAEKAEGGASKEQA